MVFDRKLIHRGQAVRNAKSRNRSVQRDLNFIRLHLCLKDSRILGALPRRKFAGTTFARRREHVRVLWLATGRSIPVHHLRSFLFSLLRSHVVGFSHLASLHYGRCCESELCRLRESGKTRDQIQKYRMPRTKELNGHLHLAVLAGKISLQRLCHEFKDI